MLQNQIQHIKKYLAASLVVMLTASPALHAQDTKEKKEPKFGLSTDFGDILIENLGIGKTYNLRELAGTPLKVKNNSDSVQTLAIVPHIPTGKMITKKRKNLGVNPVPFLGWIEVGQNEFILPPGETAFTDVILKIPDDPTLYGKKFQVSIHSGTRGKNFLQLGVWSHLVFYIIESPEAQAAMEKNQKRGIRKRADFTLLPDKIYIENVPIGKKYNIRKKNKRTIKLANSGEEPVDLKITPVTVSNSPISLQEGFIEGGDDWIKAKKEVFTLGVDSVIDPGLVLKIPNAEKYKGKKIMFLIKVEPNDPDIVGFTFYGRIYVEVEK